MIMVASYCRVSTSRDDQANSFESQQKYFRDYIEQHPDWVLYEVYADEGITGTSTQKRSQFRRMIRDAHEGKFQLIITKEVSRFSRNILDTISYTRELKSLGVGVLFVTDGIHTLNPDAELYLSIMASLAQEESRKISSRVIWGQTRQMEKGVVFGRSLLGYDVKDGKISVNPAGAEIVKTIFHKYAVEHIGTCEIANYLNRKTYNNYHRFTQWKPNAVIRILRNEKYVGDLVQKKTYTPNYLTHEKRRNNGDVPLICIQDHHEPIISREVWNMAQERLKQNNKHLSKNNGHSNRYVFSGKIKCGECNAAFVGRIKYQKDGSVLRRWSCGTSVNAGASACSVGKLVRDDDAMYMLKNAIQGLQLDIRAIAGNVAAIAMEAILESEKESGDHPDKLRCEIAHFQKRKEFLLDSYFSGDIEKADMKTMKRYYEDRLESLHKKLDSAESLALENNMELRRKHMRSQLIDLLEGKIESEVFCKSILRSLTVFKDRHMELRLHHLSQVFHFTG